MLNSDTNEDSAMAKATASQPAGVLLENLTWQEAESALGAETLVVLPLGAALKEHGPHLRLKNDWILAEYLKGRVLEAAQVVVAPTVAYHYYPAFVEYPGSVTLSLATAQALIVDICRSLARFGPRRFYVLNTGISTLRALKPAKDVLSGEGIVLAYTNLADILAPVEKGLLSQERGTHADEGETSMMLYIDQACVDMGKAVKDVNPEAPGPLTRNPSGQGTYSPTGVWGDATLATADKGKTLVEALVAGILRDIEAVRLHSVAS